MTRPDPRYFLTNEPLEIGEAGSLTGATLRGDGSVDHVSGLRDAEPGAVVFAESNGGLDTVRGGTPALIFTLPDLVQAALAACPAATIGAVERPKTAFALLADRLHASRVEAMPPLSGIAPDARIAATAMIAPSAVVGDGALIHEDAVIGPYAVIGPGVVIGPGTVVGPHVSITHAIVGAACRFAAGVRVGEAGFGYTPGPDGLVGMPQLGRVVVGERVELGANTTVDRGTLGDTVIEDGTKIDNLCQVAHNCRIGRNVLIASQTGISGSVTIGDGAMIGGQVGMADHVEVGAGAMVTAQAGLMKDVPPGERWGGSPAKPARQWMKETATLTKLAAGRRDR